VKRVERLPRKAVKVPLPNVMMRMESSVERSVFSLWTVVMKGRTAQPSPSRGSMTRIVTV
jgi:hypothetical protein